MSNTVTTTNFIQGPGDLYVGDFGATEPDDTTVNTAPAASAWTGVGGTLGGVEVTIAETWAELEVDQIVEVVESRLTKRDVTIKTQMAEPTLENFLLCLNGGVSATGAGFKNYEPNEANSATQPTYKAILLDGYAPNSKRRRIVVRKVLSTEGAGIKYGKADQGIIPVTFKAHYVSSAIRQFHIVDEV